MATPVISKRALSAKERGRKGGIATAQKSTSQFLKQRSSTAGKATLDRYGVDYYRHIQTLSSSKIKDKVNRVLQSVSPTMQTNQDTVVLIQNAVKAIGV